MIVFLLMSLLSGILEIGTLFIALDQGLPVWAALFLPAMYQLGNFMHMFRVITKKIYILGYIGLVIIVLNTWANSYILTCLEVFTVSVCLQYARGNFKSTCPVWLKRSFRIAGFALSLLCVRFSEEVIGICQIVSLLSVTVCSTVKKECKKTELCNKWIWVMVFHQMHYFVYIYALVFLLLRSGFEPVYVVAILCVSWVVYLLPQTMADKFNWKKRRLLFFACHCFLLVVVFGMAIADVLNNSIVVYLSWIITGLGGGSVFCIKDLTEQFKKTDMNFSENCGHILGVAVAIVIAVIFPNVSPATYLSASGFFIMLTLAAGLISLKRRSYYD